ncbi:MAG: hypothetical protein IJU54_00830 [Alphaproteobacteria bacterium]|nr:hypothetical protein [Alphaproteobacteria bacterium]
MNKYNTNCACTIITLNNNNNGIMRSPLIIDDKLYSKHIGILNKKIDEIRHVLALQKIQTIKIDKKMIVKYNKYKTGLEINKILTNNSKIDTIQKLYNVFSMYNNLEQRSQVLDDEFQILCQLFINADKLTSELNNKQINNINVKIFTFMDMCPACFTAWNMLYNDLKSFYSIKLKTSHINFNVDVYSIKPYCNNSHSFFTNSINNNINELTDINNWSTINSNYTRRKFSISPDDINNSKPSKINANINNETNMLSNSNIQNNDIKTKMMQHIDCDSVKKLIALFEVLNKIMSNTNNSINNVNHSNKVIDSNIVDILTQRENLKIKNMQEYYNSTSQISC